jgi:Sjoegren syndrome nuclear autoantigen 1
LKDLHAKLGEIEDTIVRKEEEKAGILDDIGVLTRRLETLKKSLAKKAYLLEDLDKLTRDSENAFGKIINSTKSLLNVIKKENSSFDKDFTTVNRLF